MARVVATGAPPQRQQQGGMGSINPFMFMQQGSNPFASLFSAGSAGTLGGAANAVPGLSSASAAAPGALSGGGISTAAGAGGGAGAGGLGGGLAAAGPFAAMAAAIMASKEIEHKNPGSIWGDLSLAFTGPSIPQMIEDPKLAGLAAIGLPFLGPFFASDEAKAAPPEWRVLG